MNKFDYQIGVGGLVLSDYEKELVNQVLDSNQLTYGKVTKKFEQEFAKSHDCKFSLFMNSGTSALHVAIASLKEKNGWSDGDEIIVPAVTFVATSNVVLHNNLKPVFVDVDPNTYVINPTMIEEKVTKRTRAIIPVHLLGLPADMEPILDIAKKYELLIVEDSCESMFAKYKDKSVGGIGDIGCFSTYVAHFLVTGIGGLATTNNVDLAIDMRSLMNHGRDNIYTSSSDDHNKQGRKLEEVIEKRFRFIHVGHSFRATEMEAALGLGQLYRSSEIIERRLQIAERFNKELAHLCDYIQLPTCPEDRTHSYMLYGIVIKGDNKREFVNYLEELNIETRDMLPLINQPIYRRLYGNLEKEYPIAKWINESGFYIGCHPYMNDKEVDYVIEAFNNYFKRKYY